MGHFGGRKMVGPHNFDPLPGFFVKFCTMKEAKRYLETILMVLLKNIVIWGQWVILGLKMLHFHNSGYSFSEKNLIWGKWAIYDLKMAHPHNSRPAQRILLKFWTMKGVKRCLELIVVVLMKKPLIWGK